MKNRNPKPFIYLLVSMYLAGLIGLNFSATAELFQTLTPFNLLSSFVILLYFHQDWNQASRFFCMFIFLAGYAVELIGVHTGLLFGNYQYLSTLGFKVWGVPPLIGINWLLLIYCVGIVSERIFKQNSLKILVGAAFLTFFDYLVEPVAIRLSMWHWVSTSPPLQNYIAWYIISALFLFVFTQLKFKKQNSIAFYLLLLQCLFFGIQNL